MRLLLNSFNVYPISLVVHSRPFLDLTYPNMQIAEERSRATPKNPGGENGRFSWLALEGEYNLHLWEIVDSRNERKGHQEFDRVCVCVCGRFSIGADQYLQILRGRISNVRSNNNPIWQIDIKTHPIYHLPCFLWKFYMLYVTQDLHIIRNIIKWISIY